MLNAAVTPDRRSQLAVGLLALAAFLSYSFFPWATTRLSPGQFNSPDETANFFFAARLAAAEGLRLDEPLNGVGAGLIHPRSTRVVNGAVVPSSFLGLPLLYGGLALALGSATLPYLTPLAAVVGILACYGCWRRWFGPRPAVVAAALLAVHPAFWYYASRGFYHNVLFVSLLAVAVWGYCRLREEGGIGWLIFSLLTLAAAIAVRSSELVWVVSAAATAVLHDRLRWQFRYLVSAAATAGVLLAATLWLLTLTYGGPFRHGYSVPGAVGLYGRLATALLPFGFAPAAIGRHVWQYGLLLFLPYLVLAAVGLTGAAARREPRWYWLLAISVSAWLAVYYGSWEVQDTVGPPVVTIGTSYVRYWLPAYVLWLPFAGAGLTALAATLRPAVRQLALAGGFLLIAFWSFLTVFFDPAEGLTFVAQRLQAYRQTATVVERLTSPSAIIVGDRSDKAFFPRRRVIVSDGRPVFDIPEVREALPRLAEAAPLYLQAVGRPDAATRAALAADRFSLVSPVALPDGTWLYRLVRP